jgi:hypothetical protein
LLGENRINREDFASVPHIAWHANAGEIHPARAGAE